MSVDFSFGVGLLLALLRSAGLVVAVPVLGESAVPIRTRVAAALVLGTAAFFAAGSPAPEMPVTDAGLVAAAAGESLLGLSVGLSCRIVLLAATGAGALAGMSMGLGFGLVADPLTGVAQPTVARLLTFLAVIAAAGLGLHRQAVLWLASGLRQIPPGHFVSAADLARGVVVEAIRSVGLAVRIAFPVVGAVTFGHVVLGLLGRTAPSLNLVSIGFSIAIVAGGFALYLVAPSAATLAARAAAEVLAVR
ncbi:MAG: type III secretion protein [Deltaproteobacteria bacterium]|nr:MAG: type III secretion protein [Deltaproteobacteria bacterium]